MNFQPRSRSELGQLLLLVGIVLLIPPLIPSRRGAETGAEIGFNEARLEKLVQRQPNVVMVGNSMLNSRVDKPKFNQLCKPNTIGYVAEGGTRSTAWYWMMKNFTGPLNPPPKMVFIFYRDYDFTMPWLHLEGEHLTVARTFMRPEDGEMLTYARLLGGIPSTSKLDFYLPEKLTLNLRRRVGELAIDVGAVGQGKTGDTALQEQLTHLFEFKNLRANVFDAGAIANDLVPGDNKIFTVDPSQNLLGKFNAFAKERGIQLVFYRVKRRPNAQNEIIQDGELVAYTAAFRAWAESQGHLLIDETEDPRITLPMYHDGDHLGDAATAEWTDMFFERVKHKLPLPPDPPPAPPAPPAP